MFLIVHDEFIFAFFSEILYTLPLVNKILIACAVKMILNFEVLRTIILYFLSCIELQNKKNLATLSLLVRGSSKEAVSTTCTI